MSLTYLEAISKGFPLVQCSCIGNGDIYETIEWAAGPPIPSKETLDEWILANSSENTLDTKITGYAFRKRFTLAEKINIEIMSIDNVNASMEQRQLAATIRILLKDIDSAEYIDLSFPETIEGIRILEQFNVIQPNRASVILSLNIEEKERLTS